MKNPKKTTSGLGSDLVDELVHKKAVRNGNHTSAPQKPRTAASEAPKQVASSAVQKESEVNVVSLTLPFLRVYPVTWMHFHREQKLLTVARANATIEIWSYPYWHLVTRIYLQREVAVRKAWTCAQGYTFIVTTNGYLGVVNNRTGEQIQWVRHGGEVANDADYEDYSELEAAAGLPVANGAQMLEEKFTSRETTPGNSRRGSRVFADLATQLKDFDGIGRIVVSCKDGAWRLYEISDKGLLSLKHTSSGRQEEATSCSFNSSAKGFVSMDSITVGYSSGDIRLFSSKTFQQTTLIAGERGANAQHAVWTVKAVAPHFVVAGNSLGRLRIHEARFGTLIKEVSEHDGDILSLEVSQDGTKIYASGADSRIAIISKREDEAGVIEFAVCDKYRGQSHDVYCLIEVHDDLLISAGHSTDICLYKINGTRFAEASKGSANTGDKKSKPRHITSVNAGKLIDYSAKSGLLALNNFQWVDLFQVSGENIEYVAKINTDAHTIKSVSLSQSAGYIAIVSAGSLELFSYNKKRQQLSRVSGEFATEVVKCAAFSGQKLYFVRESMPDTILQMDLSTNVIKNFQVEGLEDVRVIDLFKISRDGLRVIAVDKLNQVAKTLDLVTKTCQDLSGFRKARIMDASFCEATNSVYIVFETNIVLKIDSKKKVVYFSSGMVPDQFRRLHDRFYTVHSHPTNKHKVLLTSQYAFVKLNTQAQYHEIGRKNERDELRIPGMSETAVQSHELTQLSVVKTNQPLAGVVCTPNNQIVMVRFDWKSAMSEIADPLITKKFGL